MEDVYPPCFEPNTSLDPEVERLLRGCYGEALHPVLQRMASPPAISCLRLRPPRGTPERAALLTLLRNHVGPDMQVYEHPRLPVVLIRSEDVASSTRWLPPTPADPVVYVSRKCAEAVLKGAHIFAPGVIATSKRVQAGDRVAVFGSRFISRADQPNVKRGKGAKHEDHTSTGEESLAADAPTLPTSTSTPSPTPIPSPHCPRPVTRGSFIHGVPSIYLHPAPISTSATTSAKDDTNISDALAKEWLFLGYGVAEQARPDMFRFPSSGVAVRMTEPLFVRPSLHGLATGSVMAQGLTSVLAALEVGATAGMRVLDMCASPGGKTTAIAEAMDDEGHVLACDVSKNKIERVGRLCDELGLKCVQIGVRDARKHVDLVDGSTDGTSTHEDTTTKETNNVLMGEREHMVHPNPRPASFSGANGTFSDPSPPPSLPPPPQERQTTGPRRTQTTGGPTSRGHRGVTRPQASPHRQSGPPPRPRRRVL